MQATVVAILVIYVAWAPIMLCLSLILKLLGLQSTKIQRYVRNVFVAEDQKLNAMMGGDEDETISSRSGKLAQKGITLPSRVIDFFALHCFGQANHCADSIEEDEGKNAL